MSASAVPGRFAQAVMGRGDDRDAGTELLQRIGGRLHLRRRAAKQWMTSAFWPTMVRTLLVSDTGAVSAHCVSSISKRAG